MSNRKNPNWKHHTWDVQGPGQEASAAGDGNHPEHHQYPLSISGISGQQRAGAALPRTPSDSLVPLGKRLPEDGQEEEQCV
ncbi:unnamed protein product, partial [Pleuronectes platessa]